MEGEEGTNQQGCSKFYNTIQTMCRIVPVLILPFGGIGGFGVACLLFLCECVACSFSFTVCRRGPQCKCLPFLQSLAVQILISIIPI